MLLILQFYQKNSIQKAISMIYIICLILLISYSKFGISYLLYDKTADTILRHLKIVFNCYGYPKELGSDNKSEFKNSKIESYLYEKNIKFIHGSPYNPHSQGVVERFHQTIKDILYSFLFRG